MDKLQKIDTQIQELNKRKQALRRKAADMLLTKVETLLGKDFTPELALGILKSSWDKRDEMMMGGWQKEAETFFRKNANATVRKNKTVKS